MFNKNKNNNHNHNDNDNNHFGSNVVVFKNAEWITLAVTAYSPTLWGELFYKEFSVHPIPSYPALLCQDNTSWNEDDQANINT